MSILSTLGISIGADVLDTILLRQGRNIAGIIPDCVIEERHGDFLEVTNHPVEEGTPISDHAFKRPMELSIRAGWSASSSFALVRDLVTGNLGGAKNDLTGNPLKDIYNQLLDLQNSMQPFSIVTGKRSYDNMLLVGIEEDTTKDTENALIVELTFREVIIVQTQSATLPPVARQLNPQKTAEPVNTGTKQPVPVSGNIPGLPS
jgi:hypothetical protein